MKVPRHEKLKPRRTKFVVDFLSFVKTRDQVKNGSPEMQHFVSQDGKTGREEPILEIILRGHISSLVNSKVPCWPTTDTHPWVLHCYIGIQVLQMIVKFKTFMKIECHNWRKNLFGMETTGSGWGVFVISSTRDETTTKTSPIGRHNILIPQHIHLTWDRFALLTQFCRSAAWCNSKRPRIIW